MVSISEVANLGGTPCYIKKNFYGCGLLSGKLGRRILQIFEQSWSFLEFLG